MPILTTSMTVPEDFPPLETPWNCYIPLRFTRRDITRIYDHKDPIFQILDDLKRKELCDINAEFVYGRVQGKVKKHKRDLDGDGIKHPEDDKDEDEDEDETRCPKVFAVYLSEDELGTWKQLDGPVRGLLGRYFGVIPLPVR